MSTAAIFLGGMLFFGAICIYQAIRRYQAESAQATLHDLNDLMEVSLSQAERETERLDGAEEMQYILSDVCDDLEKDKSELKEENERLRARLSEYWLASN